MKKFIVSIVILQMIFAVFLPKKIFAAYDGSSKSSFQDMTLDGEEMQEKLEDGTSDVGDNGNKSFIPQKSTVESASKVFIAGINAFPTGIYAVMSIVAYEDDFANNQKYGKLFSIEKLVLNKIKLFDINFFDRNTNSREIQDIVKDYIAKVYIFIRNIAIVISLILLIYLGIRMAIATVAEEKAKYKKMLIDWTKGFVGLMGVHYFMIIIIEIGNAFLELIQTIYDTTCQTNQLEWNIIGSVTDQFNLLGYVVYWIIIFYQLKFFCMYFKRLFSVAFLIVISPLIFSSYSLDKIGDGQAQAISNWLKEFALNIFMQPIHALLYLIFFVTAANIANVAPIITILFLASLSRCERVIRKVFNVKNTVSVQSMKKAAVNFESIKGIIK